jgi:hypothetical protein
VVQLPIVAQVRQYAREWVEAGAKAQRSQAQAVADAEYARSIGDLLWSFLKLAPELAGTVENIAGVLPPRPADLGPLAGEAAPTTGDAVRLVLQEKPGYEFWISEVVNELRERGWLPPSANPANAIRTSLERLIAKTNSDTYKRRWTDGTVTYSYMPDREAGSPRIIEGGRNYAAGGYDELGEEPF